MGWIQIDDVVLIRQVFVLLSRTLQCFDSGASSSKVYQKLSNVISKLIMDCHGGVETLHGDINDIVFARGGDAYLEF